MKTKSKHYEGVAVDILYLDTAKEPLTVAVVPRDEPLQEWLETNLPRHKMPPDTAMVYTYNVTIH